MKIPAKSTLNQAIAVLLLVLTAGCAVMRVDVDVYKGPLANHEDVQIKQFAALAMGAKPLLIFLRNNLMWHKGCDGHPPPAPKDDPEYLIIQCRKQAVEKGWYNGDTGIIRKLPPDVNSNARKVNTVLSLYGDLGDPLLQGYDAAITAAEQRIINATTILKPDFEQDQKLWHEIEPEFLHASEYKEKFKLKNELGSKLLNKAIEEYRNALKQVISPCENIKCVNDYRTSRRLESSYQNLKELLSKAEPQVAWAKSMEEFATTRASLSLLVEPGRRSNYSELLFRNTSSEHARKFDQKLESIGRAATDLGEGLRKIWKATIDQIVEVATYKEFEATRDRYIVVLANLIGQYTQPQHVAAALQLMNKENKLLIKFAPEGNFWDPNGSDIRDWPKKAGRAIELAFAAAPVELAQLFHELDEQLIDAQNEKMKNVVKVRYRYLIEKPARTLGLVRIRSGFFDSDPEPDKLLGLDEFRERLKVFTQLRAEGLDKGRPVDGIERTIDRYLRAWERTDNPDDAELRRLKRNLVDALIQLSEKMLVLANNEELLRIGLSPHSNGGKKQSIDEYVLVLQAIGNSIQVQADDLTHRNAHDKKLGRRAPAELQALNQAQNQSPSEFFEAVHTDLRAIAADAQRAKQDRKNEEEALGKKQDGIKIQLEAAEQNEANDKTELGKQEQNRDAALKSLRMAFDAYRSLGETPEGPKPAPTWQELKEGADTLNADTKKLKDDVLSKPDEGVDGDEMLKRIKNSLGSVTVAPTPFQGNECENSLPDRLARALRINCAWKYFDSLSQGVQSAIQRVAQEKAEAVLKKVVGAVGNDYLEQSDATNAIQVQFEAVRRKHVNSSKAVGELEEQREALQKQMDAARRAVDVADTAQTKHAAALDVFEKFSGAALSYADNGNKILDARTAWDRLLGKIKEEIVAKTKSPGDELTKLHQALEALSGRSAPSRYATWSPRADNNENQRDILDKLIGLLRYEHVLAVKKFGESNKVTQDISAALKFAYDQRSGMAYIRPANAYLRSSYAATALQDDPRLRWENMLQKHAGRNLKLFPGCNFGNYESEYCADERRIDTLSSIDKQFWQNVNSVRVAGGGNTNYAIVKDDIGNWYVKGYSADPKPILHSAQSLAMFGAGASIGANLLQIRNIQDKIAADTATKEDFDQLRELEKQGPKGYTTGARKLFDRYKANYLQTAQSDREELLSRLENGKLKEAITTAWDKLVTFSDDTDGNKKKSFLKSLDDLLQATAPPLDDASAALQKDKADTTNNGDENAAQQPSETSPEKIVFALKKINRFDVNLTNGIAKLNVSETADAVTVAKGMLDAERKILTANETELRSKQQLLTQATDILQKLEAPQERALTEAISKQRAVVEEQQTAVNKANQVVLDQKTKVGEAESKVKAMEAAHKAVTDNRDKAHASAKNIVDTLLLEIADRRKKAADHYEQAIVFIGDGLEN